MNTKMNTVQNESGVVLIAVICFTAIAAVLAAGLMTESSSQLKIAGRNVNLEQAFYVAEGGAERAVAYISRQTGLTTPTCITGSIGNGNYAAFIVPLSDTSTGGTHTLNGSLNINPNNSPANEFLLVKPDGTSITRDDLAADNTAYDSEPCVYYSGPATLIHVKPMGAGNQNDLSVDGAVYSLNNSTTYDFVGEMNIVVQTDNRNPGNHRATPPWRLDSISGDGITLFDSSVADPSGMDQYEVRAIGAVEDARRTVIMEGIHQQSWSKYALWYNSGPGEIWITSGEVFNGPVHANTWLYLTGSPIFNALVSTTKSGWGSGPASAQFNGAPSPGYQFNAPLQSMASVDFNVLRAKADLVVTGLTKINLAGTNMIVSNSRSGWTNNTILIPSNCLVYVTNAASGASSSNVYVGGVLDGRLTIVTDNDIYITNHLTYAVHPTNNSDDALGLVARHDVIVADNTPDDLNLFAHIMAVGSSTAANNDGSFKVNNIYRSYAGYINLYGGIVQYYRGAVGTTSPTGYRKNYTFDQRLETQPPPDYPSITNEYLWTGWREK